MQTPDEMKAIAWKYFLSKGLTEEGTAGLMGNLTAESAGFYPNRVEFLCLKRLQEAGKYYTDATYTAFVDDGTISKAEFLHPLPGRQYGYGLAQWTTPARKSGLYDLCKARNASIADLRTQLDYLMTELQTGYKSLLTRLQTTHDIMDASTQTLIQFEQPADTGSAVRKTRYDYSVQVYTAFHKAVEPVKAEEIIKQAKAWIGLNEADGSHMQVVEVYNAYTPRARGYALTPRDNWCDAFVSACFIKAGAVSLIGGTECGVEEHVKIFQKKGIWNEDGKAVPEPGWIIVYNWDKNTQPNDGYSDHIGIVEKCDGKTITAIDGNYKDAVGRREIPVGWGYIRGYAVPGYTKEGGAEMYYVRSSWLDIGSQKYKGDDLDKAKEAAKKSKELYVFDQNGKIIYPVHASVKARIERAVLWANAVAADKRHGYDNREGYRWGQQGDFACSSLMITAYDQAGVPVKKNGANVTADMYRSFIAAGFEDVTAKVSFENCSGMVRGDILLTPGKHTEMYIGSKRVIGARGNPYADEPENGKPGDQGGEIVKTPYYNYPWKFCLRYVGEKKDTKVQAGSFEVKANADKRKAEIKAKTGTALTVAKSGKWYVVRSKAMTKEAAKELQTKLKKAGFEAITV